MSGTRVDACQVMSCWRLAADGMDFCEEHGWQETPPSNGNGRGAGAGLELLERMDAGEPLAPETEDVVEEIDEEEVEPEEEPEEPEEPAELGATAAPASADAGLEEAPVAADAAAGANGVSSSPSNPYGLRKFGRGYVWTREAALQAVRDFAEEYGRPPSLENAKKAIVGALPSSKSAKQLFGSWPDLIETAGFERPKPGAQHKNSEGSGREPQAAAERPAPAQVTASTPPASKAGEESSRPDKHIRVPGTGLTYRDIDAARTAADEIEADGERVARQARDDGAEGKADQAIDASRALARKIRAAAGLDEPYPLIHEADEGLGAVAEEPGADMQDLHEDPRSRGGRKPTWTEDAALALLRSQAVDGVAPPRADFIRSGISNSVIVRLFGTYTAMVDKAGLTPMLVARHEGRAPDHLLVRPEEMAPFQRALVRGLIAGMRAAADTLEQDLAE